MPVRRKASEPVIDVLSEQQQGQFSKNPLPADTSESWGLARHRLFRPPIESEAELRDEASGAQESQRILEKSLVGVSHGAHQRLHYVGFTAPGVEDLSRFGVNRNRVHGEVAPGEIINERGVKGHFREPMLVGIGFSPVGRHLGPQPFLLFPKDRTNRAESFANKVDGRGPCGFKQLSRALG